MTTYDEFQNKGSRKNSFNKIGETEALLNRKLLLNTETITNKSY